MAAASDTIQTITRLTPLAEVLATVDFEVKPVTPRTLDVGAAIGRALASDATAPARPSSAVALQDGWALAADDTLGAGGYAPVQLTQVPDRVEAGQAMPPGTDSVAPFDAVKVSNGPRRGAGHRQSRRRRAGGRRRQRSRHPAASRRRAAARDRPRRARLRRPRACHRARAAHSRGAAARQRHDRRRRAADGERHRTAWRRGQAGRGRPRSRRRAGRRKAPTPSSAIGGTGSGRNDTSVRTLAREGKLAVHGIGAHAGRNRGVRICRAAAGAAAAGPARCGAGGLAHGRAAHAGAPGGGQSERARGRRDR